MHRQTSINDTQTGIVRGFVLHLFTGDGQDATQGALR